MTTPSIATARLLVVKIGSALVVDHVAPRAGWMEGVAADIAPSVAFLASEESGWVTGQLLVADAGMSHS